MEYAVYWLIALVVLLVIEAATLGLATIWFAGGALIALIAAMCGAGFVIQMVCFLVVSLILLIFTRPVAVRFLNKDTLKTNVDRVIGMEGIVAEEISNLAGTGKVSLGGNTWTARTESEGGIIPKETVVEVLRVEGVKLIVKVKETLGLELRKGAGETGFPCIEEAPPLKPRTQGLKSICVAAEGWLLFSPRDKR